MSLKTVNTHRKEDRIYAVILLYFCLRFCAFCHIGNDEVGSSSLPSSSTALQVKRLQGCTFYERNEVGT